MAAVTLSESPLAEAAGDSGTTPTPDWTSAESELVEDAPASGIWVVAVTVRESELALEDVPRGICVAAVSAAEVALEDDVPASGIRVLAVSSSESELVDADVASAILVAAVTSMESELTEDVASSITAANTRPSALALEAVAKGTLVGAVRETAAEL